MSDTEITQENAAQASSGSKESTTGAVSAPLSKDSAAGAVSTADTEALLVQIRDLNKKQLLWQKISTCCIAVMALAIVIAIAVVVPKASATLGHINDTAIKAQESLEDVDTMTASILDASENLNKLVDDNGETLTNAVQSLADIDFEGLNTAIKDLQDAIGPMAAFMNRFR